MWAFLIPFGVVASVAVVLYGIGVKRLALRRRVQLMEEALGTEDPTLRVDPNTGSAVLTLRGLPIRFCFTTRGEGSSTESWTEIEAIVPFEPLVLSLRLQGLLDGSLARHGLAVDLQIGNPTFDAKYLVAGAPAAIVLGVLSPSIQAKILAVRVDEIVTGHRGIVVARRGWKQNQADIQALVDLTASLAESIAVAISQAKLAEAPLPASVYRGAAISDTAQQDLAARHAAEVTTFLAIEKGRKRIRVYARVLLVAAAIVSFVAWALTHPSK